MNKMIHSGEILPDKTISICGRLFGHREVVFWRLKSNDENYSDLYEISPTPNFAPGNTTLCVGIDYIRDRVFEFSPNHERIWREDLRNLSEIKPKPCECLQKMAVDIRLTSASKWVFEPSHDWQKGVAEIEFQMLSEQNTIKAIKIPAKYCPLCGKKYQ